MIKFICKAFLQSGTLNNAGKSVQIEFTHGTVWSTINEKTKQAGFTQTCQPMMAVLETGIPQDFPRKKGYAWMATAAARQ